MDQLSYKVQMMGKDCSFLPTISPAVSMQGVVSGALLHIKSVS